MKVIFFSDITYGVSDDVNNEGYAVVTKGSVCFFTKVAIFLKSWSGIWVEMTKNGGNQGSDVENQSGNLGKAVEMK